MNYNRLLNKLSENLESVKTKQSQKKKASAPSSQDFSKVDFTPTLLNKIGLEVQRQGGN